MAKTMNTIVPDSNLGALTSMEGHRRIVEIQGGLFSSAWNQKVTLPIECRIEEKFQGPSCIVA
jgi:hypothetical protein